MVRKLLELDMRHVIAPISRLRVVTIASFAALGAVLFVAPTAEARPRQPGSARGCSHYGHGCISGPVRPAKFGAEVRMPGGTWIGCGGDCGSRLVEVTIDFWDINNQSIGGRWN